MEREDWISDKGIWKALKGNEKKRNLSGDEKQQGKNSVKTLEEGLLN